MEIINLTPHALNIYNENKELVLTVAPSEMVARTFNSEGKTKPVLRQVVNGVPFDTPEKDAVGMFPLIIENGRAKVDESVNPVKLPEFEPDTILVVSGFVRAIVSRIDLWQPGELLRDDKGRVVGCAGLSQ